MREKLALGLDTTKLGRMRGYHYRGCAFFALPDKVGPGGIYSLPRQLEDGDTGGEELLAFERYSATPNEPRQEAYGFGALPRILLVKDGTVEERSWSEARHHELGGAECKPRGLLLLGEPLSLSPSGHPKVNARMTFHYPRRGIMLPCAANVGCVHFDEDALPRGEDYFFVAAPQWTGIAIKSSFLDLRRLAVGLRQFADYA